MIKIRLRDVIQPPKKTKMVTIRVPEDVELWMKRQNVSPTKVFKKSIRKLGGPWK